MEKINGLNHQLESHEKPRSQMTSEASDQSKLESIEDECSKKKSIEDSQLLSMVPIHIFFKKRKT